MFHFFQKRHTPFDQRRYVDKRNVVAEKIWRKCKCFIRKRKHLFVSFIFLDDKEVADQLESGDEHSKLQLEQEVEKEILLPWTKGQTRRVTTGRLHSLL